MLTWGRDGWGRLAEPDQDDWLHEGVLTDAVKAFIEERCRGLEANPPTAIP